MKKINYKLDYDEGSGSFMLKFCPQKEYKKRLAKSFPITKWGKYDKYIILDVDKCNNVLGVEIVGG